MLIGVTQLEIFTLTPSTSSGQALTLSLKGEGISELRKSYPDRGQAVGQDGGQGEHFLFSFSFPVV